MGGSERNAAKEATKSQGQIAGEQAELGRSLIAEGRPLQQIASKYYTAIAKGGDALQTAAAPYLNVMTQQYQQQLKEAKELPLGGSRDRAIREIKLTSPAAQADIRQKTVESAIQNLANIGQGNVSTGMGGFGDASANYANIAQTFQQMASGKSQAIGGMAGGAGAAAASLL